MRLLVLLLSLLLWGCSGPSDPPPSSITPIDQAKVAAARINIKQDPVLAGCQINLKAENDLLVISGSVPSEDAKKKAEDAVRRVRGINKVANHLQVVATPGATPADPFQ